ncbi:circadian-associated transcriptional repressor [Pelodytes ibericus]
MEDTESSDFLSSGDSLYSVDSTTASSREDANYVDFDVFLSGGLEETDKAVEDLRTVSMIPNSRLSSADHPALIRLENEYQARRSHWHQHSGQYFGFDGRISYATQTSITSRGSPLGSKNEDKPLKPFVCSQGSNPDTPQGIKRARKREADLSGDWWKERQQQSSPVSEGDKLFAQKCRELQGFIKPLTDLLNGLKKGRYDRGLSTFQQSVAMDRIQRIIGVLQKPEMGERYLGTLLQVEMMLKIWFPSVTSSSSGSSSSDYDMDEPEYKIAKHPNDNCVSARHYPMSELPSPNNQPEEKPAPYPAVPHSDCICCKERMQGLGEWPTMNLTWMQAAQICNPPPQSQADLHHLSRSFGPEILVPNVNNCGIILLLHNNLAPASPSPHSASATQTETQQSVIRTHCSVAVTKDELPLRSQSAPVVLPSHGKPGLGEIGGHSRSLSHLPMCTQRPAGENT